MRKLGLALLCGSLAAGCASSTPRDTTPDRVLAHYSDKLDPFNYARALESLDDAFNTPHENAFEREHPHINLCGPPEHLTKEYLTTLTDCLKRFPQEPLQRIPLTIILAIPSDNNRTLVNFKALNGTAGNYGSNTIILFNKTEKLFHHEIAHALDFNHPERDALKREWNAITTTIDGKTHTMGELHKSGLVSREKNNKATTWPDGTTGPGCGFASAYAASDKDGDEDRAETAASSMVPTLAEPDSYDALKQKVDLLAKYNIITPEAAELWHTHNKIFEVEDKTGHFRQTPLHSRVVIRDLTDNDRHGRYLEHIAPLLDGKTPLLLAPALKYVARHDHEHQHWQDAKRAYDESGHTIDLVQNYLDRVPTQHQQQPGAPAASSPAATGQ